MDKPLSFVPRIAIFLAGVAAGALTLPRRESSRSDPAATQDLRIAIQDLEKRLAAHESANSARFHEMETRIEEQAVRLADVPSTGQIVAAMEQLLSKTMSSLDDRLTTQARSIEVLKTTVSQTDSLLERVLESLDSLHGNTESPSLENDSLLRPV
jgi:uncharacterized membrane protein